MPDCLPGTLPLTETGDRAAAMVAGIDRYLLRALAASVAGRDVAGPLSERRASLRRLLGAADAREPARLEYVAPLDGGVPGLVAHGPGYAAYAVRWPVFDDYQAEGLLLAPDGPATADVIALGDCAPTAEAVIGLGGEATWAGRLAASGCRVIIPALINRGSGLAGVPGGRKGAAPHRVFV